MGIDIQLDALQKNNEKHTMEKQKQSINIDGTIEDLRKTALNPEKALGEDGYAQLITAQILKKGYQDRKVQNPVIEPKVFYDAVEELKGTAAFNRLLKNTKEEDLRRMAQSEGGKKLYAAYGNEAAKDAPKKDHVQPGDGQRNLRQNQVQGQEVVPGMAAGIN